MSWEQNLVNAQVEIDRAVFEMNRPGYPKGDVCHKDFPDIQYIDDCIIKAMKDLNASTKELRNDINFDIG